MSSLTQEEGWISTSELKEDSMKNMHSPQILLLTVQYPVEALSEEITKTVTSLSQNLQNETQILVQQVDGLLPSSLVDGVKDEPENVVVPSLQDETSGNNFSDVLMNTFSKHAHIIHTTLPDSKFPDKLVSPTSDNYRVSPIISFENSSLGDFACSNKGGLETVPAIELNREDSEGIKSDHLDDINLPNSLCSVGWDTDETSQGSREDDVCHVINDKPVVCRAKATLPAAYLRFEDMENSCGGIFVRRTVQKRTQFGPMAGVQVTANSVPSQRTGCLVLTIINQDDSLMMLDVDNEELSNWMRYVRPASRLSEVNVMLSQHKSSLYFTTTRVLHEGEEVRVWYSEKYASDRSLPLLTDFQREKWQCSKCSFKCGLIFEMERHMEEHWDDSQKLSEVTGITRKSGMNKTKKNLKKDRWWCSRCSLGFEKATTLNFHMLAHAAEQAASCCHAKLGPGEYGEKSHNCGVCQKRFCSNSGLACHTKCHSEEKKFECPICKAIFTKVLELKRHIHSHSKNGVYSCNQCSKEFLVYKHIRKHIKTVHCGRKYKCITCGKKFRTSEKLKNHQLCHSDKKQFRCANCGKQFKRKDKLCDHMKRIHYPESIRVKPSTDVHKVAEIAEFNQFVFKCDICIVGFKRRGMLVNHMVNRHPDVTLESIPELNLPILKPTKDYYCQYCDKIYKSSSKRKAHILKFHPGEELPISNRQGTTKGLGEPQSFCQVVGSVTTDPQGCQWCHKQYASKAKLLQHQRSKHLNMLPKLMQESKKVTTVTGKIPNEVNKVTETSSILQDSLITPLSEYEISEADGHYLTDEEFIVDSSTLKKALKKTICPLWLQGDIGPGLEQLMASGRTEQFLRVGGQTHPQPVEIWDDPSALVPFLPPFNPR